MLRWNTLLVRVSFGSETDFEPDVIGSEGVDESDLVCPWGETRRQ
jgi:hypothetical protein